MAEASENLEETGEESLKKRSKLPLILGLILCVAGGGGGFMAVQSGLIAGAEDSSEVAVAETTFEASSLAFVPVETLVINLPQNAQADHLLFTAQLEVDPDHSEEVSALMPRIVDVLNGYLRAVRLAELEDPTALVRLRAQMLRRVQVVVGEGRVKDILIMEFVLN